MKKNKTQRDAAKAAASTQPAKEIKNGTPATPAPKEEKSGKAKLNEVNATGVVKEITDKKDLKYIYPEDAKSLELRKKFRTGVRAKIKSYMKQVTKLTNISENERTPEQNKELIKAEKEFTKYSTSVLVQAAQAKKAHKKLDVVAMVTA